LAELTAIHHGLQAAIDKGLTNLVCYADSQTSIDLILRDTPEFHIYATLIQDIKDLLARHNFPLLHTLREGNQCADVLAKRGAISVDALVIHDSPLSTFWLSSEPTQWELISLDFNLSFFFCLSFCLSLL
jgi:ribonuclease HI